MQVDLNKKKILITGGTGSLGRILIKGLLRDFPEIKELIVFSRDEFKQSKLQRKLSGTANIKFLIGDIRDKDKLISASQDVDIIIHSAAMKCLDVCEHNIEETFKSNVIGTKNVIEASIHNKVKKVLFISSDKAVDSISQYGNSKKQGEDLFIQAGQQSEIEFNILRLGNIFKSRGSVFSVFKEQSKKGRLIVFDSQSARFLINSKQLYHSVLHVLQSSINSTIVIPKLPVFKVSDLAKAYCPDCQITEVPLRKGEKTYEDLFSIAETESCFEDESFFYLIKNEKDKASIVNLLKLEKTLVTTRERSSETGKVLALKDLEKLINKIKTNSTPPTI